MTSFITASSVLTYMYFDSIYMYTPSFRVSGSRLENAKYHGVVTDNIFDTLWSISVDEKASKK